MWRVLAARLMDVTSRTRKCAGGDDRGLPGPREAWRPIGHKSTRAALASLGSPSNLRPTSSPKVGRTQRLRGSGLTELRPTRPGVFDLCTPGTPCSTCVVVRLSYYVCPLIVSVFHALFWGKRLDGSRDFAATHVPLAGCGDSKGWTYVGRTLDARLDATRRLDVISRIPVKTETHAD